MYNLAEGSSKGYFNESDNADSRNAMRSQIAQQRSQDYKNGTYARTGGLPDHMDENAPQFQKDYFDYYKTKRGYHERSVNSNGGWVISSMVPYVTTPMNYYIEEIDEPVMICPGDKAHSFYFSTQAFGN